MMGDQFDRVSAEARSAQSAAAIRAHLDGKSVSESYAEQNIVLPPPGTPIDEERIILAPNQLRAGDVGVFADRLLMALGNATVLVSGQVQPIDSVSSGPDFLGWIDPTKLAHGAAPISWAAVGGLDEADAALMKMLGGATINPAAKVVLPSGRTINGAEAQALSELHASVAESNAPVAEPTVRRRGKWWSWRSTGGRASSTSSEQAQSAGGVVARERGHARREIDKLIEETSSAELPAVGDWCVRSDHREVIAKWIPDDAIVGPTRRILVLGDVGRNAWLIAKGGGARIDIMGSVHTAARIGAAGGGAHILIRGEVAAGAAVYACGGGARVEFLSESSAQAAVDGGAAEVLRLDASTVERTDRRRSD